MLDADDIYLLWGEHAVSCVLLIAECHVVGTGLGLSCDSPGVPDLRGALIDCASAAQISMLIMMNRWLQNPNSSLEINSSEKHKLQFLPLNFPSAKQQR